MQLSDIITGTLCGFKKSMESVLVFTKQRIRPIGYNFRYITITNALTPSNAYPDAVRDTSAALFENQDPGVIAEVQLRVSFKGNSGGDRFFVGVALQGGETMNVQQASNLLTQVVYDQTSDIVLSANAQYSPYAGPYVPTGARIFPVIAGDNGGTVYYSINIKIAQGNGFLLGQN